MTGTTIVARFFKKKGFKIIANDILHFSYTLAKAYIENNEFPQYQDLFKKLLRSKNNGNRETIQFIIHFLNNTPPRKLFIYNNYCPEGTKNEEFIRKYFTCENAMQIDSIRQIIEDWKKDNLINENELRPLNEQELFSRIKELCNCLHLKDPKLKTDINGGKE